MLPKFSVVMNLKNLTFETITFLLSYSICLGSFTDTVCSARLSNIDLSSYILNPHNEVRITALQFTRPEYCINSPLIITFTYSDVHQIVQSVRQGSNSRKFKDILALVVIAVYCQSRLDRS